VVPRRPSPFPDHYTDSGGSPHVLSNYEVHSETQRLCDGQKRPAACGIAALLNGCRSIVNSSVSAVATVSVAAISHRVRYLSGCE
jgi:hypothetical protein